MGRKQALTDTQKAFVLDGYLYEKKNQTVLAELFNVSRRTIQRALMEKGVDTRISQESAAILAVVRKFNLDAEKIQKLAQMPALTPENVRTYLSGLSHDTLANLFFTAATVKALQAHQRMEALQSGNKTT